MLKAFQNLKKNIYREKITMAVLVRSMEGTSVGVTLVMNSLTIQIKGRRFATFHQLEYA